MGAGHASAQKGELDMKKRLLALGLALAMLLAHPVSATQTEEGTEEQPLAAREAQEEDSGAEIMPLAALTEPVSGACGDNLTWTLDTNYVLTISGTGPMVDYPVSETISNCRPWASYRSQISAVVIGPGVTRIGNNAFRDCQSIAEVTIPDSVTEIGESAFDGCSRLKEVDLPNTVTTLGWSVFAGTGLIHMVLPNQLTHIGYGLFSGCSSLETIQIPESVTAIGSNAFYFCTKLRNIALPQGLTSIGDSAFWGSALTEIDIPEGVSDIGGKAFTDCKQLERVTLPDSLTKLGGFAFQGCTSLRSITIPSGIRSFDATFYDCSNLTYVFLECKEFRIAFDPFQGCGQLKALYFYEAAPSSGYLGSLPDNVTLYYLEGQPGWTTPTWNGYPAYPFSPGMLLDEPLYNNGTEFHHWIYDYNTGLPIQGARAVANSGTPVYSDADGIVVIPADTMMLEVTAEGYATVTTIYGEEAAAATLSEENGAALFTTPKSGRFPRATALQKSGKVTVTGVKAYFEPTGEDAFSRHDIYSAAWGINKHYPPTSKQLCVEYTVTGEYNSIKLMSGTKVLATNLYSDQKSSFSNVPIEKFNAGQQVAIVAHDAQGKELCRLNTRLTVVDHFEAGDWSVELGEGATVTVPSNIPFFGGMEFALNLPDLPATVTTNQDGIRVTFGGELKPEILKNEKSWKKFKEALTKTVKGASKSVKDKAGEIKAAANKAVNDVKNIRTIYKNASSGLKSPSWGDFKDGAKTLSKLTPTVEVVGYVEKNWGAPTGEGQLLLVLKAESGTKANVNISGVATVLGAEIEGGVETGFTLAVKDKFTWSTSADVGLGLEVQAGVGAKDLVEAGVYGEGSSHVIFLMGTGQQLNTKDWFLHGGFGVRGQVLIFEAKKELWSGDLYIIKNGRLVKNNSAASQVSLYAALTDADGYQMMDRDYLAGRSPWMAGEDEVQLFALTSSQVKTMQENAFYGAAPQLVTNGTDTMIVFEDDDESRADAANRTRLMYSLYDSANDTWSTPQPVFAGSADTAATADFSPVTAVIGNEIYVLCQKAKTPLTDEMDLTAVSKSLELTLARYDATSGSFTDPETLTSNEVYEAAPQLADLNGAPVVYWVENSAGDPFCSTGTNHIRRAVKDGTGWTVSDVAAVNGPLYGLSAGTLGDSEALAWLTEEDVTIDGETWLQRTGYLWTGATGTVTSLGESEGIYFFTPVGGGNALAWYDGSDLKYLTAAGGTPADLVPSGTLNRTPYTIVTNSDNSKCSILYTGSHGEGAASNLYAVTYDAAENSWGLPVALTEETERYVEALSAAYVGQDLLTTFQRRQMNADLSVAKTDLCWLKAPEGASLEITQAECPDEALTPGGSATFRVTVRNKGTLSSTGTETITLSGATTADSSALTVPKLKGGEEKTLDIPVTLPDTLAGLSSTLTLNGTTAAIPLGLADLAVEAESYLMGNKNIVAVTVTNQGQAAADGAITLVNGDDLYPSTPFRALAPGESAETVLTVDNDYFGEEAGASVTIGVTTSAQQQYLGNDETVVVLHRVYGGLNWADLSAKETASGLQLTGSLENAAANEASGSLILAAYDSAGKQLTARQKDLTLASGKSEPLDWTVSGAAGFKVFLLDKDTAPWLFAEVGFDAGAGEGS